MKKTNKIYARDSRGRFVSLKNPPANTDIYISTNKKKILIKSASEEVSSPYTSNIIDVEKKKYKKKDLDKLKFKVKSITSSSGETTYEFVDAKNLSKQLEKIKSSYKEKGKNRIDEYSPKLEKEAKRIYGNGNMYNLQKQLEIIDIFKEANKKLFQMNEEYGVEFGKGFHLYQSDDLQAIEKKLNHALDILDNPDYISSLGLKYKLDFINNFKNHLSDDEFEELSEGVLELSNTDFLIFLKSNKIDWIAYSLDSVITNREFDLLRTFKETVLRSIKKQVNEKKKQSKGNKKQSKEKKK